MKAEGSHIVFTLPEGVTFRQPLAGPFARMCACIIDYVLAITIAMTLGVLAIMTLQMAPDLALAVYFWILFGVFFGYHLFFEACWRGQTPGKKMCRLRVISANGLELRISQVIMRNILRLVDILPGFYLIGGLASFIGKAHQRLGDVAANTLVVRVVRPTEPDLDQVTSGKHNSLLQHPHLAARLRQRIGPEEASLLLQAVLRREKLEPLARAKFFAEAADWLKDSVKFPDETVEHLTDEQYVRNVLGLVFARRGEGLAR